MFTTVITICSLCLQWLEYPVPRIYLQRGGNNITGGTKMLTRLEHRKNI